MKKYLAIYMAPQEEMKKMMENNDEKQRDEGMKEWRSWMAKHKEEFVDDGNPVGKTKEVREGGKVKDVKNDIGGYSIVEANSHEEAAEIFADSPHFHMPRARVEVMEVMEMA